MTRTSPIEHCWVLIGETDPSRRHWRIRRRRRTRGEATTVEADWAWALAREETHGDVVGFWHTHVRGIGSRPSLRDLATMRAWCTALGKPLICVITAGRNSTAHVYEGDTMVARRAELAGGEERGVFTVRRTDMPEREHVLR